MCSVQFTDHDGNVLRDRALFCGCWEELLAQACKFAEPRGFYVGAIQQCFRGFDIESALPSPSAPFPGLRDPRAK